MYARVIRKLKLSWFPTSNAWIFCRKRSTHSWWYLPFLFTWKHFKQFRMPEKEKKQICFRWKDVLNMQMAKTSDRINSMNIQKVITVHPWLEAPDDSNAVVVHGLGLMWILDPWENGPNKMAEARKADKTSKLLHLPLLSSCSHFVQQLNDSLDLLKPAKLTKTCHIEW